MFSNLTPKKRIIYIIVAVLVAAAITVGTIFLVRSLNNSSSSNKADTSKESADTLKDQAIEALKTNSTNEAKTLFQEAKQKYEAAGDKNNVVDTEAQLYLLEHK